MFRDWVGRVGKTGLALFLGFALMACPDDDSGSNTAGDAASDVVLTLGDMGGGVDTTLVEGACNENLGEDGACTNAGDCADVEAHAEQLLEISDACAYDCTAAPSCVSACVSADIGVSIECGGCFAELITCAVANCLPCSPDECAACLVEHDCDDVFTACAGFDLFAVDDGFQTCPDGDNDTYIDAVCGGDDCNDGAPGINPGAVEVCDAAGIDEDCNPQTLAGPSDGDGDHDGFISELCCNQQDNEELRCGPDCDDGEDSINPNRLDGCGGGDENCNGISDDNPDLMFYRDFDQDEYGTVLDVVSACSAPDGYLAEAGDCDDRNGNAHPGLDEICETNFDDNCADGVNEDCPCIFGTDDPIDCGPDTEEGACEFGTQECQEDNSWGPCEDEVMPSDEECDADEVDEDCNGSANADDIDCECNDGQTQWCQDPNAVAFVPDAPCTRSQQVCVDGTWSFDCDEDSYISAGVEVCDSETTDEDCDGTANVVGGVTCVCNDGDEDECGTDAGVCTAGTWLCTDGEWGPCDDTTGSGEVCDHLDNNCNNITDDGFWADRCQRRVTGPTVPTGDLSCSRQDGAFACSEAQCFTWPTVALGHLCGYSADFLVPPTGAFMNDPVDFPLFSFEAEAVVFLGRNGLVTPSGEVALTLTPEPYPGDADAVPHGLPILSNGEVGLAAYYHVGSQLVSLYKLRDNAEPELLATSVEAAGCAVGDAVIVGHLKLEHALEQFTATMWFSGDGACTGRTSVSFNSGSLFDELYEYSASYPTYYVGAVGHEDRGLYVNVYTIDVDTYGACACPGSWSD